MATEMDVRATWATEWQFEVDDDTGHHITLDVDEQEGGHNAGVRSMGMLLVALAGWIGMSVLPILLKKRQQVTGYELHVHRVRAPEHPKAFTEISIEHVGSGHSLPPEAMHS